MNLQVGRGTSIHLPYTVNGADGTATECGSEYSNGRRQSVRKVAKEVTCKRCLKIAANRKTA